MKDPKKTLSTEAQGASWLAVLHVPVPWEGQLEGGVSSLLDSALFICTFSGSHPLAHT